MSYDISQIQQLQSDISTLATNLSNLRTSKIDAVNAVEVNLGDIGIANGVLTLGAASPTDPNQAVTKAYVDALNGNTSQFAAVAITGEYDDLLNKPTIPTNNNQLTNGAGYATVAYVDGQIANVDFSDYSNTAQMEIAIDTSNTAMRVYVDAQIANIDFSDYSTTVEIANAISTSNSLMQTYVDGEISTAIANTQNYTDIAIADLVDSAPVTLDTLNELAAALGDDANFSATTSTALGYRLRFDIDTQGLTATQKSNALTNLGISGTFDGTFDGLSSKTSGTGEYSTSGNLTAGRGSGGVSLTTNDGYGNANITWNHKSGVPEQNGNAARIEVNTDSTSGASMYFELKSNVSSGTAVSLTNGMTLTEGNLNINGTITGGFGAVSTSGTTNWNNSTNARSGMGYTLLLGTATNGPGGSYYYHPFSFEYSSKDGSGNMTQFAIPYTGPNLFFRSKYNGAWSGWTRVWTTDNFSSTDISNWNTAYGWGDHASAGYITSSSIPTNYVRDDADDIKSGYLLFNKTGTATSTTNYPSSPIIMRASGWDTNNSAARNVDWYIRAETLSSVYPEGDLVFYEESPTFAHEKLRLHGRGSGSSYQDPDAATFKGNVNILQTSDSSGGDLTVTGTVTATGGNSTNWNTAYGWGDHATAGYQSAGNYVTTDTTQNITGIKEFQDDVELRFGNSADARVEWNNANSRLITRVYTHGGYIRFQAENTAGTNRNVLSLSGDTGVTMYHDAAGECAGTKSTGMYSYGLDIAANSTSTIGTRANSLSVLTTGSNSPIACKVSTYDTVFSVLPWSSGITYLASGVYYDGGSWVHASDNAYNCLFEISGTNGARWFASNNSTGSWNLASSLSLWNNSGQWVGDINTTYDINTGSITLGTISEAPSEWNPVLLEDGGIIKKDSSVQIHGSGYLRAAYLNMTHASSTRNADTVFFSSNDSYIRKNDKAGMQSSLGIGGGAAYVDVATGNYGTVKVDDDRSVTWAGYAIRDDWVFMSNGAGQAGIYNDTDNEWMQRWYQNSYTEFYHNGTAVSQTSTTGLYVNSGLQSGGTYLDVTYNATGAGGARLYDSQGVIQSYWYGNGAGEGGLLDNDGSWFCRARTGTSANIFYCNGNAELYVYTSYVRAIASFRAPIFYDQDDTAYYLNPAGTSNLNAVQLQGLLTTKGNATAFTSANDTTISVRSSSTSTPAVMSFHRPSAYAMNLGLDTDNHFKLGGWSASTVKHTWQNNGTYLATGDIYAYYSDERLKTKQGKIENAIDKVNSIETFYYTHNDLAKEHGFEEERMHVGVSAQTVEKVMPEVVALAPFDNNGSGVSISGEDYKTVQYEKLVPLLIEAIKELKAEIEELKK